MSNFVTIAVPAYNHGRYITECLEAAAAQTWPDLDLVVIDDGSRDDTFERIEAFAAAHRERFRHLHAVTRPNRGLAATYNDVFRASRTDWVCPTGSDDVMYPERVAALMQAVRDWNEPRLALVCGRIDWIDSEGNPMPHPPLLYPEPGIHHDAFLGLILSQPVPGPVSMLRREAVFEVGGFDERLPFEDWSMWLELSVRHPVGFIEATLGAYRRHDANQSGDSALILHGMLVTTETFLERHGERLPAAHRRRLYRKNLQRTIRCVRRSRPRALPGLLWELATFNRRGFSPADLRRYAELVG